MALCVLFAAEPSAAQHRPAELPPEKQPLVRTIDYKRAKRRPYFHDRFFLRMALGVGILNATIEPGFDGAKQRTLTDVGMAWSLELGGTPARGLVIGPMWYMILSRSALGASGPAGLERLYRLHTLGGFVAYFPDPRRGLELGASLAAAPLQVAFEDSQATDGISTEVLPGWTPGLSAGYSGWISANWSMGVLLRANVGWHDDTEGTAMSRAISIMGNALYH
jgi:hypothetical protein